MIDEVEILAYCKNISGILYLGVFLVLASIITTGFFFVEYKKTVLLLTLLFFSIGLVIIFSSYKNPNDTYKVIVNEQVSFTEFMNKYEILEKEGLIYTVKEIKTLKEEKNG